MFPRYRILFLYTKMDRNLHNPKAHWKVSQISKMELFAKIINSVSVIDSFCKRVHLSCLTDSKIHFFTGIQKYQLVIIFSFWVMLPKTFMFDYFLWWKKKFIRKLTWYIFFHLRIITLQNYNFRTKEP